jgi:hypothetical protein
MGTTLARSCERLARFCNEVRPDKTNPAAQVKPHEHQYLSDYLAGGRAVVE